MPDFCIISDSKFEIWDSLTEELRLLRLIVSINDSKVLSRSKLWLELRELDESSSWN